MFAAVNVTEPDLQFRGSAGSLKEGGCADVSSSLVICVEGLPRDYCISLDYHLQGATIPSEDIGRS
jgi:hypothetical protein